MKGSATRILAYLEGADKRFLIPVYQRKYSWKEENCAQLFEDLKKVIRYKQGSHFFGSIVSSGTLSGSKIEYYIIDGQQRLTTVTLLLLAIRNMIQEGKIQPKKKSLGDEINERFLVSKWAEEGDRIKLCPVDSDRSALSKLFNADERDYEPFSQMTLNYRFFCRELQKGEVTADGLFEAVGKLEIISISLEQGDNAQLIFESLNSTGLALEEGDKIRNYVLMGLSPSEQSDYYEKFWTKIEKCTRNDVSGFVRDYLSIKQQKTPTMSRVYVTFKAYAREEEESGLTMEKLLEDMLRYARLYEKILTCKIDLNEQDNEEKLTKEQEKLIKKLNACLYRMKQLEIVVTRPFLMEVLRLNEDKKISRDNVLEVLLIVENYLFRRNICEVPTNALTKIFVSLNREILRYDNTAELYVDKLIFTLRSKRDSGRFPDDEEFAQALSNKQVYRMNGKFKEYLFERFENYGTIEAKDVYTQLDNNVYTIEHIMPQHLTPAWRDALGPNAEEIHETWQHRLANLTLTGYNPSLSNKPFQEKRDAEEGGYRNSGLRMNQKIAQKESWGLPELEERNEEMISRAKVIWRLPETDYLPPVKEYESCTLDDENIDLTNRKIIRYSYQNAEQPVTSWAEMFSNMVGFLHQKDRSVLSELAYDKGNGMDLGSYVSTNESDLRSPMKVDEQIYVETNTSTSMKLSILRRLFDLYKEDPMDLVFYLRDEKNADSNEEESSVKEIRKKYWIYALPIIRDRNASGGYFKNVEPSKHRHIRDFFGIKGFSICCVVNTYDVSVELDLNKNDWAENKKAFDLLYSHRQEIEAELGRSLIWERLDDRKESWLGCSLKDVSIYKESDWQRMAEFQAEWSSRICNVVLPYLREKDYAKLKEASDLRLDWAYGQSDVHVNPELSNTGIIRFTTDGMSSILPDNETVLSGWNTANHYFYEIWNNTGIRFNIKFVLSLENVPEELQEKFNRIRELYPDRRQNKGTNWPIYYKTKTIRYGDDLSRQTTFSGLDQCMEEIRRFEANLRERIGNESRRKNMAAVMQDWAASRNDIHFNPENSEISFIRFTTDTTDSIFPDDGGVPSGWGTDNHYFYEINNFTGSEFYIQLAVSAKGMTEEYRRTCDRITELYPVYIPQNWEFRTLHSTKGFPFGEDISEKTVWPELDQCMEEVRQFERDLKEQLVIWDWAENRKDIQVNFEKSDRTIVRFTTEAMSEVLPDLENAPSVWGTDNHYFYEIVKDSGTGFHIQYVLSSRNMPEEHRVICDRINRFYPVKIKKKKWAIRTPYRTKTFVHDDDLSRNTIYSGLDKCMEEIRQFEADLIGKLKTEDRLDRISTILLAWEIGRTDIHANSEKSDRTYTRFTTDAMNEILPDLRNAPSDWGTANHYFYEIVNNTGTSFYIKFELNSKNIPEDYRAICNRINELYPDREPANQQIPDDKKDREWRWREHFRTHTCTVGDEISKETIYSDLNQCMEEIRQFEADLKGKIQG